MEMELHRPQDLTSAISLTRLFERRGGPKRFTPTSSKPTLSNSANSPTQKTFKRLTKAEMEDRRVRGLCFNCDEVYTKGHQCKQLFWLDGVEESVQGDKEERELEEESDPEVSFKLDLPWEAIEKLQVTVANGSKIKSPVPIEPSLPILSKGEMHPSPQAVIDSRILKGQPQVLVHWEGLSPAEASWEAVNSFRSRYPSFVLEDKHNFNGRVGVMSRSREVQMLPWSDKFAKGILYQKRGLKEGS
ncbi:hypothetical protein GH714_032487 [Hevea brasiliensis]|uniref:Chromo domain-containing protein n=1 Tax=Hevea brasiliensis TaxID=3981 RepID=A0A6A6L5A3_HEVBR|nr:hypothetical protein GH714_032487 [Hevea brasiliensis]